MKKIEYIRSLSDSELAEIQKAIKTHVNPRARVRAIMILHMKSILLRKLEKCLVVVAKQCYLKYIAMSKKAF